MLAFQPVEPSADDAGVRLDVRIGNGRAVRYRLDEGEFLIGAAAGCDLRLAGNHLPPVVCQFTRSDDGLRVRKLSPTVPVAVNDRPLSGSAPVAVQNGDLVTAGPAAIQVTVTDGTFLSPKLQLFDDVPLTPAPVAAPDPTAGADDLARQRAQLAEQTHELEEERAIWYRRKMEMEVELRGVPDANDLMQREATLTARERELQTEYDRRFAALNDEIQRRREEFETELAARRERADAEFQDRMRKLEEEIGARRLEFEGDVREYEPRLVELRHVRERLALAHEDVEKQRAAIDTIRDELKRERESMEAERKWQLERLQELDQAILSRDEELTRREDQLMQERDRFLADRDQHKDDLIRLDRWQAGLESKEAFVEGRTAEVNERFDLLQRHSGEWEETLRLADAEQARLRAEGDRLERWRAELDQEAAKVAERGALLESQQASLAMLRANLARQQEAVHQESATMAAERLRLEELRRDLDDKLRDTEHVRAELGTLRDDHANERRTAAERTVVLASTIDEHRRAEESLRQKELELDERSSQFAEQAALLKARIGQALELQQRLEDDRTAVKARETLLNETDAARVAFQEQLRKRAEELSGRTREVDELRVKLFEEQAVLGRLRDGLDQEKSRAEQRLEADRAALAAQARELEERANAVAEREGTLARQVERLKEVGEAVANERNALFQARNEFESERAAAVEVHLQSQQETETVQARVAAHFAELRQLAPDLDGQAQASLERLASARDVLRGHLTELHDYARQAREELDAARSQLRAEGEQVRQRAYELESARSEHRLGVTGFRQQLLDWQSKIGELRQSFAAAETRIEQRQGEVEAATRQIVETRESLARQSQEIAGERRKVADKRSEIERHLGDMREWYRRKLRELAAGRRVDESDMPKLVEEKAGEGLVSLAMEPATAEPDPGDEHLGELLKTRGLVDENTLQALWTEARRQRRSLRQTLLASGALTLYQLALIEGGNLDGLMLGRLRVVDRIRATSKETAYRVFDPSRPGGPTRGIYVLRHLADAEMQDAVRPDEFRQRFAAMALATHPNLANSLEVFEINNRPAALQEWVSGLASTDWPPVAATPGVWLRLLTDAAKGLHHAHRGGVVHGRLAPESFVLTADGTLKILGFGDPAWLTGGSLIEPPPPADLRALGQVAFIWSQLGSRRRGVRGKPFPAELTNVIRRLEIGSEPPMGDVVAIDRPYADAGELLRDLARLSEAHPCPTDSWEKLARFAADNSPDLPQPLKATG